MKRDERLSALVELIAANGEVRVADAAQTLGASLATIRRDLGHLSTQQVLLRTRGGAAPNAVSYELPLRYKDVSRMAQKQRIATAAAGLVTTGGTVALNGGTTTTEVARALASSHRDEHTAQPAVTVVTNAVNIASELTLRSAMVVIVTGGVALDRSYELVGPLAANSMRDLHFDIAFIGVSGIDWRRGATATDDQEADINRLMVDRADRVVVVADSTKLGRRAFATICRIDAVDMLITDDEAAPETVDRFGDVGVDVLRV